MLYNKHLINILISIELMLVSVNINFINSACFIDDILGQIYCLMVLTVAAGEVSIGLALVILFYRLRGSVSLDIINLLKA